MRIRVLYFIDYFLLGNSKCFIVIEPFKDLFILHNVRHKKSTWLQAVTYFVHVQKIKLLINQYSISWRFTTILTGLIFVPSPYTLFVFSLTYFTIK
jgi:hypothetical protein